MLTVKERGHFVATLRYVHVTLMETLAAWVPTTPEVEVKLLLGEHIWDVAQHADSLGKRTFELRLPLQHSVRAAEPYVAFLAEVRAIEPTPERLAAMYDVVVPGLVARQRRYLEQTDKLVDAPTVRILERYLADTARMIDGGPRAAPRAAGAADRPIANGSPPSRRARPSSSSWPPRPPETVAGGSLRCGSPRETKIVRGIELRKDPAREPCFKIVHLHHDVPDAPSTTPEGRLMRAHREYNQEVQTLEIAALCLVDFPDAPWQLRMELARQCWDEARHAALSYRYVTELGGWKGMYPIANLDWSVVAMLDSLPARLAVQHRTFEAGSLDIEMAAIPMMREMGQDAAADVKDAVDADEIQHVRFGNEWVRRLTDADPRAVLQIAAAMKWLQKVVEATGLDALKDIPTSDQARQLAGFTQAEVSTVAHLHQAAIAGRLDRQPGESAVR